MVALRDYVFGQIPLPFQPSIYVQHELRLVKIWYNKNMTYGDLHDSVNGQYQC